MQSLTEISISDLLDKPIDFFARLYIFILPRYSALSDRIYKGGRARFDELRVDFLSTIEEALLLHSEPGSIARVQVIFEKYRNYENYNLSCLALFSALGCYIARNYRSHLENNPLEISGLIITLKPPNPIYNSIDKRVRESRGTGIHDIMDGIEFIHIVSESNPIISLRQTQSIKATNYLLEKRLKQGLKIAVSPFMDNLEFEFGSLLQQEYPDYATPYWFKCISNAECAKKYLSEILERCIEEKIAILILPELTIDLRLLDFIKKWLCEENVKRLQGDGNALLLVVAGSFHLGDSPGTLFNVSTLLNYQGDVLMKHNKMRRFQITEEDIRADPEIQKTLSISSKGGHECIGESSSLACIDTPLGRIAICICIDYFHEDFQAAFRNSGANIFFVPAMSNTMSQFWSIAPMLGNTNLASTFVANASCFARKKSGKIDEKAACFYYLPDRKVGRISLGCNDTKLLIFNLKVKKGLT